MSFGNLVQEVNFTNGEMTLILGENRDVTNNGQYTDSRNGTGKSAICSALQYVLTDKPIGNVRKDNLVNKINDKNMLVTLEFSKDGTEYKIERGRKPNILRLFIDGEDYEDNKAHGEMKDTQDIINSIIGMQAELVKLVLIMTTQDEGFLSFKAAQQKSLIEELLGITFISEKANQLKSLLDNSKIEIEKEQFKLKTLRELNEKTIRQIENLEVQSSKWDNNKETTLQQIVQSIEDLSVLDIEDEKVKHQNKIKYDDLNLKLNTTKKELNTVSMALTKTNKAIDDVSRKIDKIDHENKCYVCNQSLESSDDIMKNLIHDLETNMGYQLEYNTRISELNDEIINIENIISSIDQFDGMFYDNEKDIWDHENNIKNLTEMLEQEINQTNPYTDQISTLRTENFQKIDEQKLNDMETEKHHQEFLYKTLTNKDSFVRKKIIDQSLPFLNYRLSHYLKEIGLPHQVKFMNDLQVEIDMMGKTYDFDNLSRGQRTRLIIALNLAFRDVYESLYQSVNILMFDELIDNGLDSFGIENSIKILKAQAREQNKSVFLISHREEAKPRVNTIQTVIFENGFSSIQ